MAPRRKSHARSRLRTKPRTSPARSSRKTTPPSRPKFVGRDASPVLDKYPPKDPALAPRGPPRPPTAPVAPPSGAALHPGAPANPSPATVPTSGAGATASTSPPPLTPLLSLERPFDPDEFAQQLGETLIEVKVPRDQLAEVLRRVAEFMGFGIYVYEIAVRPAPTELLNDFVVTLRRVDFQPARSGWVPFEEKGRSDSPFGPEGRR